MNSEITFDGLVYRDEERPDVGADIDPRFGETTVATPWRPESLVDVEWMLSRIRDLERTIDENEIILRERIALMKVRTEKLNESPRSGIAFFTALIRWFSETNRDVLLKGGKSKSRKFMSGQVGWKKKPAKPVVRDAEALLAWAQAQPVESGFLRIKEEPAWDRIREHVIASGEIPPGVDVEPEEEKFEVKTTRNEVQ